MSEVFVSTDARRALFSWCNQKHDGRVSRFTCTPERRFVEHNPNERRPKLPRPRCGGDQQSVAHYDPDPIQHSPSEHGPVAHASISLALTPKDTRPEIPWPNCASSQKRAFQYILGPVECHPLFNAHNKLVHRSNEPASGHFRPEWRQKRQALPVFLIQSERASNRLD